MQVLIFGMVLQVAFQISFVGNLTGFIPDLSGVVVSNVVRLRLTGYQT